MQAKINKVREAFCSMRKALACYVCRNVISNPYKANCGHSYCLKCIRKLMILEKDCPRCLFCSIYRQYIKKDDELEKWIQKFKKMENAFQLDYQIDISEDLFQRSFAVDAEVRKRFKISKEDFTVPEVQVELADSDVIYCSDGTTELLNPNLCRKKKSTTELSFSELPTEKLTKRAKTD